MKPEEIQILKDALVSAIVENTQLKGQLISAKERSEQHTKWWLEASEQRDALKEEIAELNAPIDPS